MNDDTIQLGTRDGWEEPVPFGIQLPDLRQHVYILGKTGSGTVAADDFVELPDSCLVGSPGDSNVKCFSNAEHIPTFDGARINNSVNRADPCNRALDALRLGRPTCGAKPANHCGLIE